MPVKPTPYPCIAFLSDWLTGLQFIFRKYFCIGIFSSVFRALTESIPSMAYYNEQYVEFSKVVLLDIPAYPKRF